MTRTELRHYKLKVDGQEIDISLEEWQALQALAANATVLNALAGAAAVSEGDVTFSGAVTVEGALVLPNIPTADPAAAGELYSNADVVTVSTP